MDTSGKNEEGAFNLCIFVICWYLFTITTYGTNVPAGLFLPGMIIGCGMGKLSYFAVDAMNLKIAGMTPE